MATCEHLPLSVIPTGGDHREGDDLRSGEPALSEVEGDLVFLCGGDLVSSRLDSFLDNFVR